MLTLNAVVVDAAANYSVRVGNSASPSEVLSDEAALTVTPGGGGEAPTIVTQPATIVVAPGGSGLLAVAATGSGPLSYQWLNDGLPISGETEAVLLVADANASHEGRYSVNVSNDLGSVVSQEVRVILLGAPFITQEPTAATVLENETATFTVTANGSGLHYQWMLNGAAIAGADEASYTTSMLTTANTGAVYKRHRLQRRWRGVEPERRADSAGVRRTERCAASSERDRRSRRGGHTVCSLQRHTAVHGADDPLVWQCVASRARRALVVRQR